MNDIKIGKIFFIFSFSILLMILAAAPMWDPPAGFDAESYLLMAKDLLGARESLPPHHWQRPLPSLAVKTFVDFFYSRELITPAQIDLALKTGFHLLALLSFYLFSCRIFLFFTKRIPNKMIVASLTWILLFWSWPLTYPLNNFYQLCDLWCHLFALLMLEMMINERFVLFSFIALLGTFTRQNLIIINLFGHLLFFFKAKNNYSNDNKTNCRTQIFWVLLGALINLLALILLFSYSPAQKTLDNLLRIPTLSTLTPLKYLYKMSAPFLLATLLYWRETWSVVKRHYPMAIFIFITLYQPYANWTSTGQVNLERILSQGLWVVNLWGAILIGRKLETSPAWVKGIIIGLPILMGTSHLQGQFDWTFSPLFFLRSHWRNYVTLILNIFLLFYFWQSHRKKLRTKILL